MMKQRNYFFIASLFAGLIIYWTSCTPGSCFEETNAYLKVYFYSSATDKALPPDSLTVYGLNMTSKKIYDGAAKKQPAYLPLNPSTPDCTFIIRINGKTDTLSITYTSYAHLISKECGYTFYHTIDTPVFSRNTIDKIDIRKNTVTTLHDENIRIFY